MKFKGIIALILALVMLLTMAMPVFASPARGELTSEVDPGSGTVSLRVSHDDNLHFAISLRGGSPDSTYTVHLLNVNSLVSLDLGSLSTDSRGNGSLKSVFDTASLSGEMTYRFKLTKSGSYYYNYTSENLTVIFK